MSFFCPSGAGELFSMISAVGLGWNAWESREGYSVQHVVKRWVNEWLYRKQDEAQGVLDTMKAEG